MDKKEMIELMDLVAECEYEMEECGFTLPKINYSLNGRLSRALGRCYKHFGEFSIELSKNYFEGCINTENIKNLKQTILHEMCHSLPNGMNHGEVWKRYADKINIKFGYDISRMTTVPNEVTGYSLLNGVLVCCDKCNRETLTKRTKQVVKSPNLYRCSCGGKIFIKES